MDYIHFFGTTGNKNVFFKKIREVGGFYLSIDNTNIIMDPGINTFCHYIDAYADQQNNIDGIVLSHVHIDHSNDLNILVELMTNGGKEKKGTVLLPEQAIENKVLQPYLKEFPEKIQIVKPQSIYRIKNIEFVSSIPHRHGVENYGFVIKTSKNRIGWVTDTAYFAELIDSYRGCDTLLMNVPYYNKPKESINQLDVPAAEEFIKEIKPQKVILTHFNRNMLDHNPKEIAERLSNQYGIQVMAAEDDQKIEF